jgi:hypothetical protein
MRSRILAAGLGEIAPCLLLRRPPRLNTKAQDGRRALAATGGARKSAAGVPIQF